MNSLLLIWKNLFAKPLSTLLTVVLFALGVGLISLLLLVNKQIDDKFEKNSAGINLVLGAKGSPIQLILSSMYHLDAPTGNVNLSQTAAFLQSPRCRMLIEKAVPVSLGDSYKGFRIVGSTPQYPDIYKAKVVEGKMWSANMEAVIGATTAQELNLKIGDTFDSQHGFADDAEGHHGHKPFKVTGILGHTGSVIDQLICVNLPSIWEMHPPPPKVPVMIEDEEEHDHDHDDHDHAHEHEKPQLDSAELVALKKSREVTAYLLFLRNDIGVLTLPELVRKDINMQGVQIINPSYEKLRLQTMVGAGTDMMKYLAYIIIVVSGLSIFISLYNSLKDRRYELALMRVMGASRLKLFLLIIFEGVFLALIGYIVGMLLSHGGIFFVADYMKEAYKYTFNSFEFLTAEFWLLGGALLIGLVAAIIPAIEAYEVNISRTLAK